MFSRELALRAWGGKDKEGSRKGGVHSSSGNKHLCRGGAQGPLRGAAPSRAKRVTLGRKYSVGIRMKHQSPLSHTH